MQPLTYALIFGILIAVFGWILTAKNNQRLNALRALEKEREERLRTETELIRDIKTLIDLEDPFEVIAVRVKWKLKEQAEKEAESDKYKIVPNRRTDRRNDIPSVIITTLENHAKDTR